MDSPLERLQALAAHSAAHDSLQLVRVTGAEGLGRTHLLEQWVAAQPRAFLVKVTAEGTLGRVLRALTGIEETEESAFIAALRQSAALLALDPERRLLVAQLLASLVGSTAAGLDAASRAEGACAQLVHVFSLEAATSPLVLGLDDAHLADAETVAFLDALAHVDTPVPAMVVFTADTAAEFAESPFMLASARWPERRRPPTLSIAPLTNEAIEALLLKRGCEVSLAARLAAVVHGNAGLAVGVWSVLQQRPQLTDRALPLTFDALRVESVRALGPEVFWLAQRAAVLGETVALGALEATGPMPAAPTLLRQMGDGVVAFRDARVRLALLGQLSPEVSAPWLAAAGQWAVRALQTLPWTLDADAPRVLPLALPLLSSEEASLWREVWAGWLAAHGRAALDEWIEAARTATGVRRFALVRRIADAQLLAGQPEKVLATVMALGRVAPLPSKAAGGAAGKALAAQQRSGLESWETLSPDEAMAAVELVRAEACSHLVRKDDTVKAFTELERKLERLEGPVASHLWIRWAKSWTWFLCEILGQPKDALKACEKVRQRVPAAVLKDDVQTLEFLRAQQMACTTAGDFAKALGLVEELIALSRARGDLRAQCLAWNARAILHFGQGELAGARRSFERSLELARATGWKRREAIATHNLALVMLELGELDAAQALEERYAVLSVAIGNHAATAEAPAVLAGVALAKGDLPKADAWVGLARKAAQGNGWTMLLAWSRALAGRLRVQKYLDSRDSLELAKAKNDFLAALDLFEEHSTAWTEEVDPGEVYALYAAALKLLGQPAAAKEAIERGAKHMLPQNVVSLRALAAGRAYVEGQGLDAALEWFSSNGYARLHALWRRIGG